MKKTLSKCLFLSLFLSGCIKKNMNDILLQMEETPVQMKLDQMVSVIPDSIEEKKSEANGLKFVVFSDTTNCSQCYIDHLKDWNELLTIENEFPELSFYFVVEARKNESVFLSELLRGCGLCHTVYIDTAHVFLINNPHIDVPNVFHTFLLDKDNRVVLVGNPLINPKIRKLFIKILEENRKHRKMDNNDHTVKKKI